MFLCFFYDGNLSSWIIAELLKTYTIFHVVASEINLNVPLSNRNSEKIIKAASYLMAIKKKMRIYECVIYFYSSIIF